MAKLDNWITLKCSECGQEFDYPECEYKPETCADPDCIKKNLHLELKKGSVKCPY